MEEEQAFRVEFPIVKKNKYGMKQKRVLRMDPEEGQLLVEWDFDNGETWNTRTPPTSGSELYVIPPNQKNLKLFCAM